MFRTGLRWVLRLSLAFAAITAGGIACAAIPASERAVLDAIYAQTNGANWARSNNGWGGAAGSECSWAYVQCDASQSHVTALSFNSQNLSGTLPDLAALTNLQFFEAGYNNLGGALPDLSKLSGLQYFSANVNKFSGSIPPLAGLSQLQTYSVLNNNLTGTIPSLAGLTQLQVFNVAGNRLTGNLPALSGLVALTTFDVDHNSLTGSLPSIAGLTNLQVFNIDSNRCTGNLGSFANLPSLTYFNISGNQITGSIPDLSGAPALKYFSVYANQMIGLMPNLSGLKQLEQFYVANNGGLTGTLPSLTGLTKLNAFSVGGNAIIGSMPASYLSGLANLQYFDVASNRLTGNLPDLTGVPLAEFHVGGNGFAGDLPTPPATLLAGQSDVCDNPLTYTANPAWDAATGATPWYSRCSRVPSTLGIGFSDTPVATGILSKITATVTTAKALITAAASDSNSVTLTDDAGRLICYIRLANNTGSCDVVLPGGTTNLIASFSGSTGIAPASTSASKTTPVVTPGNLDQHGWTGAWYNPATSGQGIVFEVYPDLLGVGTGLLGGGWFTYDTTPGGEDHKRWYTLNGPVSSSSPTATLEMIAPTGGNFAAPPIINTGDGANYVGHATLNFTDCSNGTLSYIFTDGSGRIGSFPLKRLDTNVNCDPTNGAGNGTSPGKYLLSGAWYSPATSGQGILFGINPLQNITFAAWYTYAPDGASVGGGASQRWYTLQIPSANVGAAALTSVPIFSAQGGTFDASGGVTTTQVGTASIAFPSCGQLTVVYSFTAGDNAGKSGTLNLLRAGPTPAGCSL